MDRALPPQQDARERELRDQGPPWRAGSPAPPAATLRVLILALLWRESLAQQPGFTLKVPQLVSMQEGLCVLVLCTFAYPASYDTKNSLARLYRYWYKDPADVSHDSLVASSDSSREVSQETQGRIQLMMNPNPADGDCSLQISDARRTDAGRYFLRVEKGSDSLPSPRVSGLTEEPEIQISPAHGLPGTLLAGEPVTVTCTAPGRCSGPPPRVTWTGPFSDTARDVSAQLANGTWAHSSALSFTPGPGDHGEELVCTVTYRPPQGPSTRRTPLHAGSQPPLLGSPPLGSPTWEGDSLSLGCEAGNRPEAALSWAKGNESLSPSQGRAGHLELLNLSRGDAGEYRCWAKNPFGSASRTLRVHVQSKCAPRLRAEKQVGWCEVQLAEDGARSVPRGRPKRHPRAEEPTGLPATRYQQV
uniref:Ig-like domain-containing protein n=1 Tax=Gopherus evgoodei TaxID=1825980 RepID=A0A8C4Y8W2_9SAUR